MIGYVLLQYITFYSEIPSKKISDLPHFFVFFLYKQSVDSKKLCFLFFESKCVLFKTFLILWPFMLLLFILQQFEYA